MLFLTRSWRFLISNRLKQLKSVHFKNTVARFSVVSKLWSFSIIHQLTLFWFQLVYIENDLKMNGLCCILSFEPCPNWKSICTCPWKQSGPVKFSLSMYSYGIFLAFFLWSPLETMKKSCLNKLKFWEASRNQKRSICWKFQLSISLGRQKSPSTIQSGH